MPEPLAYSLIGQCGAIVPAHAAAARSRDRVLVEHELAAGGWRPLLSAHAGRVDMSASNLSLFKTTKSEYTFIRCQKNWLTMAHEVSADTWCKQQTDAQRIYWKQYEQTKKQNDLKQIIFK